MVITNLEGKYGNWVKRCSLNWIKRKRGRETRGREEEALFYFLWLLI